MECVTKPVFKQAGTSMRSISCVQYTVLQPAATTCTSSSAVGVCGTDLAMGDTFVCGGESCPNWLAVRVSVPDRHGGETQDELPEQGKPRWKTWLLRVRHARLLPVLKVHCVGISARYVPKTSSGTESNPGGRSGFRVSGQRARGQERGAPLPPDLPRRSRRFWRLCARSTFHHGV